MKNYILVCAGLLAIATAAVAREHPCLYFDEGDIPGLMNRAGGDKILQFERLRAWGDAHLDELPPADIGIEEKHHESCFSVITNYGVLYRLTGEPEYLEAGRRWTDALLALPPGSQDYFIVGTYAASLAHAYDLLHDGLEVAYRDRLRRRLIAAVLDTRRQASSSWWAGIYTHHDFWIPVAFMGVAALAVSDEMAGADSVIAFAEQELDKALGLLGDKGYWPEGVADWVYGMAPALMFFDALRRSGGRDFYRGEWMRRTARARLMHWLPDDGFMYLGDSFRSGRYGVLGSVAAHLVMRLAAEYRDPHAQWLAQREAHIDSTANVYSTLENPYSFATRWPVHDRERHGLAWQFLWYDPSLAASPPGVLETAELYPVWDTAIMRAGWEKDDPVVAVTGGHLLGELATRAWRDGWSSLPGGLAHTHNNAGSLYIWADGHFPLRPAGFGGRDGRFQSTVMVNGHGQLFDPAHKGEMTSFEHGEGWNVCRLELAGAYPEDVALGEFTRTVVFLEPRTIVMHDRLRGAGDNYIRRYEWLLQTDPDSCEWIHGHDFFAASKRGEEGMGSQWLVGKVFPSYRYYFERQSMDRPDGMPVNRALSVTVIGRMPPRIEIPAVLHLPAPGEDTSWIHRVECLRTESATALVVKDGPYFLIPTGPPGTSPRTVVFATGDEVEMPEGVPAEGQVLVTGLGPDRKYRARFGEDGALAGLLADSDGEYTATKEGNLLIGQ